MKFIYLNKYYSIETLIELKTNKLWLRDIQSFLIKWSDQSESIKVNTSGSTGIPKSIELLKSSMRKSANITNNYFGLDTRSNALLCLPAKYIAGQMMIVRALVSNMDLIVEEPSGTPNTIQDLSLDFTAMTPMQVENILNNNGDALNLIKTIIIGGGAISSSLSNQLQNIDCHCYQTYGMTETITHIALQKINGNDKTDHFTLLEGFSIDQDNRGCLTISAGHIYGTHVVTNDLVEILNNQSFKWLGRYDNVINSGGIKIHPELVESKIQSILNMPYFIIGKANDLLGQEVVLCVESPSWESSVHADFLNQIKSRLSKFEIPRSILFFDCFLYTETGKIRRGATLDSYQ